MTNRPRLKVGAHMLPGLVAVALFGLLAVVFVDAGFDAGEGFEAGVNITASIGYAMFNLAGGAVPSEGFLVVFIVIALVLDAALESSIMLASRESESVLDAVRGARAAEDAQTDGGEPAGAADGESAGATGDDAADGRSTDATGDDAADGGES